MTFSSGSLYLLLKPSPVHLLLVVTVHLLGLAGVWLNILFGLPLRVFLTLAVLASLVHALRRRVLLLDRKSVTEVIYSDGDWRLRLKSGELVSASLKRPYFVGRYLVVLRFHTGRFRETPVVLMYDALHPDVFRRCRVLLRFGFND